MTSGTATVVIILAAFWVAIAALLLIMATRRIARANAVLASARSTAALLRAAPARPLLVHADGRVEIDSHLQRDLGLEQPPERLDDLARRRPASDGEDLEALEGRCRRRPPSAGRRSSGRCASPAPTACSKCAAGSPAAPYAAGTLLLWLFDTSGVEGRTAEARAPSCSRPKLALDSLTHLIESAPFPMWYRGPDLSLGLVNSAFVAAVEARDAAEVIARGSELIDSPGEDSARAGALAALEAGRPYVRTQPATIGGERRMLKLVDVPLGDRRRRRLRDRHPGSGGRALRAAAAYRSPSASWPTA